MGFNSVFKGLMRWDNFLGEIHWALGRSGVRILFPVNRQFTFVCLHNISL
jgi:hypothetical protein